MQEIDKIQDLHFIDGGGCQCYRNGQLVKSAGWIKYVDQCSTYCCIKHPSDYWITDDTQPHPPKISVFGLCEKAAMLPEVFYKKIMGISGELFS